MLLRFDIGRGDLYSWIAKLLPCLVIWGCAVSSDMATVPIDGKGAEKADLMMADGPEPAQPAVMQADAGARTDVEANVKGSEYPLPAVPQTEAFSPPIDTDDVLEKTSIEMKTDERLPKIPIFLDMRNVELPVLLRTLARSADQSMMISESVRGSVTLNIRNQPWQHVFQGLIRTYGLTYEWNGGIIQVMTLEDSAKEFKRLDIEEKKELKRRGIEANAPLTSSIIKIEYADVEQLRDVFENFLTEEQGQRRGSVMVDSHTNSLIIQATQSDIDKMVALVEKLDHPTLQVRIEAQIVEANSDTARELGVQWGGVYKSSVDGRSYNIGPGSNVFDTDDDGRISPEAGLIQTLPSLLQSANGLDIGFVTENFGKNILAVQLTALEEQGKLKILSSPSISTLDNQKALIESGAEVPYRTVEDFQTSIQFKKAVIRLEVTPHVIGQDSLKLKIITFKDELDFTNTVDGNPTIITKKAETTVMLRDGQTTVIGGLRKETINEKTSAVPFLSDIPLLGHLFKREMDKDKSEELLLFITPYIVKNTMESSSPERKNEVPKG